MYYKLYSKFIVPYYVQIIILCIINYTVKWLFALQDQLLHSNYHMMFIIYLPLNKLYSNVK